MSSGSSGDYCLTCGSKLAEVKYYGNEPDLLALMKSDGFCGFLGCLRVDLHDRVVDGVNYRGKAFVIPIVHGSTARRRKRGP